MSKRNRRRNHTRNHEKAFTSTQNNQQLYSDEFFMDEISSAYSPKVTVPITFHGLQTLISQVWPQLKQKLSQNRDLLRSEDALLPTFRKGLMYIAMAKLLFSSEMHYNATHMWPGGSYEKINRLMQRYPMIHSLPKPFAMYINAIGKFTLQGQTIVPRLTKHKNTFAFNVAPNSMDEWLLAHATPVVEDEDFLYTKEILKEFNFKWEKVNEGWRLSPEDVTFYSGFPTPEQENLFVEMIWCMESYNNMFPGTDGIPLGLMGSPAQAVRFTSPSATGERDYYLMRNIPHYDEALAPFFCLGEDGGDTESPLVGDILYCYKRGHAQPATPTFLLA